MLKMSDKVRRLPRGPQGPSNVPRSHSQRVDQHPGAMADVLVFTSLAPARLSRFGGRFALQHLHTGFFIAADEQVALLIGRQRLDIELANRAGFRIEMLIVTVEPVLAFVRLQIDTVQDAPDARAAEGMRRQ